MVFRSVVAIVLLTTPAIAGDLNPPTGAPAPTMKTLTEVEPRTPVNAANTPGDATAVFRITQHGSYYLTGNIMGEAGKSGVVIDSDDVTLDLDADNTIDPGEPTGTATALWLSCTAEGPCLHITMDCTDGVACTAFDDPPICGCATTGESCNSPIVAC